jgi:hypothetical protein
VWLSRYEYYSSGSDATFTGQHYVVGREMDVNTGPWELIFQDAATNKATLDRVQPPA